MGTLRKPNKKYMALTWRPESKTPTPEDWRKCLNMLVGPQGLEPWTKGL